MQKFKKYIPAILFLTPFFVLAANTIQGIITIAQGILQTLIPLLMGFGLVVFLWGVIKYVSAGGDEEKRKEARNTMIWGIVALFVMVAVWGLVYVLSATFQIDVGGQHPEYPEL